MKYPKGGSYAVSEDGIHFTKSHDIFTDDENPSPFRMDDGRIGIIHSGFSADKGWFAADRLAGPWSLVDDKVPTAGDCPCPFSWNGWHHVAYGGLSVPMVADWTNGRKILVGWINGLDRYREVPKGWNLQVWGGRLCFRADPRAGRAEFTEGGAPRQTLSEVARGLDMSKGRRIVQIAAGHLNAPYTAQNYAIGKIRGLDRPFNVRLNLYYDPKADGTVFDAEIAGTRTMVARSAGRYLD